MRRRFEGIWTGCVCSGMFVVEEGGEMGRKVGEGWVLDSWITVRIEC